MRENIHTEKMGVEEEDTWQVLIVYSEDVFQIQFSGRIRQLSLENILALKW